MRQPVQLIRYANRLEIRNPGFSLIPDERLGQPGSLTRNDKIAAVLHEVGLAETKGSGIRAMRAGMEKVHLAPPFFESDRQKDAFTVMLLTHHLFNDEDLSWLSRFKEHNLTSEEAFALLYTKEVGVISNAVYRNIHHVDALTASYHLCRLRDAGLLIQAGKGSATYYQLPEALYRLEDREGAMVLPAEPVGEVDSSVSGLSPESSMVDKLLSPESSMVDKPLSPESGLVDKPLSPELKRTVKLDIPAEVRSKVKRLGQRATPADVMLVIEELCQLKALQAVQIAAIIGRDPDYVRKTYLTQMIKTGRLRYQYPNQPNRPDQAYLTSEELQKK